MNHPARKHKLFNGQCIYHWQVVRLLPYRGSEKATNKRINVKAICRPCGKEFEVPEYYILRPHSPKKHCGCLNKSIITNNVLEYRSWVMMHVRCYNPKHVAFKHYGGRGIHVCEDWHKDNPDGKGFERFLAFMGKRPSLKFSLDRVDNDGSYYPYQADGVTRQCRWADAVTQRANQRQPQGR